MIPSSPHHLVQFLGQLGKQTAITSLRLAYAQAFLNFPTLRHARVNYRNAEILLERFDDIKNAQLATLEINCVGITTAQKQVSCLIVDIL